MMRSEAGHRRPRHTGQHPIVTAAPQRQGPARLPAVTPATVATALVIVFGTAGTATAVAVTAPVSLLLAAMLGVLCLLAFTVALLVTSTLTRGGPRRTAEGAHRRP